jgi:hypothetical protein
MKKSSAFAVLTLSTILLIVQPLPSFAQTVSIKDFAAGNLLVDSGTTGGPGTTSSTGWTGQVAIDAKGRISGRVAVRSWADNVNRSTLANHTVKTDGSRIFAPVARVMQTKETNNYIWGREVVTTKWYEADFVLRTTQVGVLAKGRARLEIRQDVVSDNEAAGKPNKSTNTTKYIRLSGALFGPAGQVGEFYAGN